MDYCSLTRTRVAIRIFSISSNRWYHPHTFSDCSNNDNLQITYRKKTLIFFSRFNFTRLSLI